MAHKRIRYARLRPKRARPKTPAPTEGWVIADLSRITGVPLRRLRYYLERGLIEPLEVRGTATRYPRRELLRVLGIVRLQADTRARLGEIKRRLDALSAGELEAWLRTQPLPPSAAGVLNLAPPPPASGAHAPELAPELVEGSTWRRISLLPGLELMLASDASPAVQRAARSICAEYVRSAADGSRGSRASETERLTVGERSA